tara:strand:+ start:1301 stop:3952 length:2652 start_codon:yes stop_codon:yes gene_type:complete
MTIFCLNIVLYNGDINLNTINLIFNKFSSKIKKARIIHFSENISSDNIISYLKNKNIEYNDIDIKFDSYSQFLETIIEYSDNDMTNILIDSDQQIIFNDNLIDYNFDEHKSYYINHTELLYSYPKLFIFGKNTKKDESPLIHFSSFPKTHIFIDDIKSNTNNNKEYLQNKYKIVCNIKPNDKSDSHNYVELIFYNYIIKNFDIAIKYSIDINDKEDWFINYILSIGYFNNSNYKKSIDHANKCLQIDNKKIEPLYILSKILYMNKAYKEAQKLLFDIDIRNIQYSDKDFVELEIYLFFIHCQNVLVNKALGIKDKAIDICECLLFRLENTTYYNIINQILSGLTESINSEIKPINLTIALNRDLLENEHLQIYKDNNNNEIIRLKYDNKNESIELKKTDKDLSAISNVTFNNFTSLMHNNNLIIIDCDFSRFSIFNLDSDMSKLIKYKQFDFPWKNVRIVTKFIRIYNIYVAITKFVKTGFFHFICLNNDFKPIYISKSFKIKINSDIINIEKESDSIHIYTNKRIIEIIQISDLYFKYNLPIEYTENVKIEIENQIELGIKTHGYILPNNEYKNYIISENNIKVEYDFNLGIIKYKKLDYSKYLDSFIYLPKNIENHTKKYVISLFNRETIDKLLIDRFNQEEISDDYRVSEYLIINNYELEKLDLLKLSNIIESKTIIISLISEDSLENNNIPQVYSQNEYLNRLFLFNIVKNTEYIDFILEKIIKSEQYKNRQEYMSIDLDNIYNNCNIFQHFFTTSKDVKKILDKYENELTKDKYREYLITRSIQNINDTNIIEIIKYIIINMQDIEIYYNVEELPSILELVNIFAESFNICDFNDIKNIEQSKCILYVNTIEDSVKYRCICDEDSLIYCLKDNFIYYT